MPFYIHLSSHNIRFPRLGKTCIQWVPLITYTRDITQ
jgi:hypothetical protein